MKSISLRLLVRLNPQRTPTPPPFTFSDGRNGRLLRASEHCSYCVHHARKDRPLLEAESIGERLAASLSGEFPTATAVNVMRLAGSRAKPRFFGVVRPLFSDCP